MNSGQAKNSNQCQPRKKKHALSQELGTKVSRLGVHGAVLPHNEMSPFQSFVLTDINPEKISMQSSIKLISATQI